MKYTLPCGGCGKSLRLSAKRYRELVKARSSPSCRECERLGGVDIMDAARNSQVLLDTAVSVDGAIQRSGGGSDQPVPLARMRFRRSRGRI